MQMSILLLHNLRFFFSQFIVYVKKKSDSKNIFRIYNSKLSIQIFFLNNRLKIFNNYLKYNYDIKLKKSMVEYKNINFHINK